MNRTAATLKEMEFFLYRLRKRIFSQQTWVILYKAISEGSESPDPDEFEITKTNENDLRGMAIALPDELAGPLSEERRLSFVSGRFQAGILSLVARRKSTGEIVGGCWCKPVAQNDALMSFFSTATHVFEISTLFVTPSGRGNGIGSALVDKACREMSAKGFQGCVSLVWYSRKPSIVSHLRLKFMPVAEKVTTSFLGIRRTSFRKGYRDGSLPEYSIRES